MRLKKLRNWNGESLVGRMAPRSIATLLLCLLLSACDPRLKWNEQVQLQSGEVIVIKRTAKFSENWIVGGGGGSFNKGMTIEFSKPNKPDNPTIWNALYVPMVLDRDPETNGWSFSPRSFIATVGTTWVDPDCLTPSTTFETGNGCNCL